MGTARLDPVAEAAVERPGFRFTDATDHRDAGGPQLGDAAAGHQGLGSVIATTTRATPARIRASLQGVRPWWQQGSSVTTTVPPLARAPAWARACTSAWAVPALA